MNAQYTDPYPGVAYPGLTWPGVPSTQLPPLPILMGARPPVLTGPRSTSLEFDLLDRSGLQFDSLQGVQANGWFEWTNARPVQGAGQLTITDQGQQIDWRNTTLRMRMVIDDDWGSTEIALGAAVPSLSQDVWLSTGLDKPIELLDVTSWLEQSKVTETYGMPKGSLVTDWMQYLLDEVGWPYVLTPSNKVSPSDLVWDTGTTYLRVINDMAQVVNYFGAASDGAGVIHLAPYVAPQDRHALAWRFIDGVSSIYTPNWTRSQDQTDAPDQVLLTTAGTIDTGGMSSWYTPRTPTHPRVYTEQVEAADQPTLDAMAVRKWNELNSPGATISITHMPVPLRVNDAVWFRSRRAGIDRLHTVQSTRVNLTGLGLQQTVLAEVPNV